MKTLRDLIAYLDKLEEKKVKFHLDKIRDSILIELTAADQMWEIEFMEDGTIEIERFSRYDETLGANDLNALICEFAETEEEGFNDLTLCGKDAFGILEALDRAKIFYTLDRDKENKSIVIAAVVPGQRWRITVFADGTIHTERYLTTHQISDEQELNRLFEI